MVERNTNINKQVISKSLERKVRGYYSYHPAIFMCELK